LTFELKWRSYWKIKNSKHWWSLLGVTATDLVFSGTSGISNPSAKFHIQNKGFSGTEIWIIILVKQSNICVNGKDLLFDQNSGTSPDIYKNGNRYRTATPTAK
jgi:hypothetical protein